MRRGLLRPARICKLGGGPAPLSSPLRPRFQPRMMLPMLPMLLLLLACAPETPTWHADVAPILVEKCSGCHASGEIGPFPLDSYESAGPMASAASAAVDAGTMPPFDAFETDDCTPPLSWKDDPRLSDDEKATLRDWAAAGAPEGDPADAAALPNAIATELEDASQELIPDRSYTTSGDEDEFVCVSLDPGLGTDRWFTGMQVIPGNAEVVHHVVLFSDAAGDSAAWGDSYTDCSGFDSGEPLGVWVPGSPPTEVPDGSGILMPAGARVVMQMHYHPVGVVAEPDTTTVQLSWRDDAPEWTALITSIGNFASEEEGLLPEEDDRWQVEFRIPADDADHTETLALTTEAGETDFYFFSVETHMHMVGTGMEIRWERADPRPAEPKEDCLVQTGWDFDWQRTYYYDAEIEDLPRGRGGDSIWMQCTYDNTLDNPSVVRALADAGLTEPIAVNLGEGSLDEMCIGIFGVVYQ